MILSKKKKKKSVLFKEQLNLNYSSIKHNMISESINLDHLSFIFTHLIKKVIDTNEIY